MKNAFLKKLAALFKEAGPLQDWAAEEEGEAEHMLKAFADKLAAATAAYGDGAGLAADHPLHALKALYKEMEETMAADAAKRAEARKAAEDAEKAAKAAGEGDAVTKAEITTQVSKAVEDIQKKLEAAEKRAESAETLAKAERDAREVEAEKATLRKYRHVTVDVEKDAAVFAKMRQSDKTTYDFMMAKLDAAEAIGKKATLLERDLGSPLGGDGQTAWAEIEAEADKIVSKGEKGITREKAIDQVMKAKPELVARYKAEQSGSPS